MADDGPDLEGRRMRLVELVVLVALAIGADRLFPRAAGWAFWAIGLGLLAVMVFVVPSAARWLHRCRAAAAGRSATSGPDRVEFGEVVAAGDGDFFARVDFTAVYPEVPRSASC
ncbi:hypothetical protein [Catellatospora citrea]|uniref:Uncharacterized protein n=1 Tax=Catellatospora citrea TaxID=53366 RepID=A0A8J3KV52_9ACTN|nr:hypothetical protein [Catellatospora citrea]GIG02470.1 hypothetical protein Cci01nite_75630 [Catellatospora citrea]